MFDGLTNPASAEAYTDKEINDIKAAAAEGNDNYIFNAEDGALIGMEAYNTGKVFWYDAENGKKITVSAAPLILDGETGDLMIGDGIPVAKALD